MTTKSLIKKSVIVKYTDKNGQWRLNQIRPTASDEAIFETAKQIAALQTKPVDFIQKVDVEELQER